jgi:hypothetical protein
MGEAISEVAVICTNDDPLGFFVESSHWSQHYAEIGQKVNDRATTLRVA